jgi:hypothetical protein
MKTIQLTRHERILAIWPEVASGPGWRNEIVYVYVEDTMTSRVRTVDIQPHEQSPAMEVLFKSAAAMAESLRRAVPTEVIEAEGVR